MKKKMAKKCKEMYRLIQEMRNCLLKEIIKKLNQILTSYFLWVLKDLSQGNPNITVYKKGIVKKA